MEWLAGPPALAFMAWRCSATVAGCREISICWMMADVNHRFA
jgi:hypothetical protein